MSTRVLNVPVAREDPDEGYEDFEEGFEVEELEVEEEETYTHSYVPDPEYGTKYVHRTVNGIEDFALLDYCMENGVNLLLAGDTGAGKTMLPMAYAAERKIPYYSVPCDVSIDPRSLFGRMMTTENVGEFEWQDGPVTEMVRNGGVLNISEVNFMPAKISAALFPVLDHRRFLPLLEHRGEVIRAHKDLLIVADMNPKYRGTVDLNMAFGNRFAMKVLWDYHEEVENSLVKSPELLSIVRKIRKESSIRTPIGTNMMMEFVKYACDLGVEFATKNFVGKFADAERDPVSKLFEIASTNIRQDISAVIEGSKPDKEIPEMMEDPDWYKKVDYSKFEMEPDA